MSKRLAIFIIIMMLTYLVATPCASAMLVLYSPQDMIERSSLIVDATVVGSTTERTTYGGEPVETFKVNAVLKGITTGPTITVSKSLYQPMPNPGTRVMVLLQVNPSKYSRANYIFTGDVNNIGIIKGGKVVDIFNGVNIKGSDRIAIYNNFYQ
ncbi:MAG TPA: hypothetical protein VE439_03640, partial [Anaerolineae bacterium]|nr:hypothetical protein [Anaerolineae bacterium]